MAQYEYICYECSNIKCEIKSMLDRDVAPICTICKKPMMRVISPSFIKVNGYNAKNNYSDTNKSVKGD
jgi:hypothetical protein